MMEPSLARAGRWPSYQAVHQPARGHGARPVQTPRGKSTQPRSTVVLSLTRQGLSEVVSSMWTLLLTWRTVCMMPVIIMATTDQSVMLWESMPRPVRAQESPSTPGEELTFVVSSRLCFDLLFFSSNLISKILSQMFTLFLSSSSHHFLQQWSVQPTVIIPCVLRVAQPPVPA